MSIPGAALLVGSCCLAAGCAVQIPALIADPRLRMHASELLNRIGILLQARRAQYRRRKPINIFAYANMYNSFISRIFNVISTKQRKREIEGKCLDELPELIDVLALGLSAGLSFDASASIYCQRYTTMLSQKLSGAIQAWQLGFKSRQEALDDLASELNVGSFTTFVNTVNEALVFGAPLASTLVEQADTVREQRRSALEESIEKAPVKMVIPITTMILPAMLIAIVGPLFSSFINTGFN